MIIIDAHLDIAWNALQWNRNIEHSVYTIRTRESNLTGAGRGQGTVAQGQLAYYRALNQANKIRVITNKKELDEHIDSWLDWEQDTSLRLHSPTPCSGG